MEYLMIAIILPIIDDVAIACSSTFPIQVRLHCISQVFILQFSNYPSLIITLLRDVTNRYLNLCHFRIETISKNKNLQ